MGASFRWPRLSSGAGEHESDLDAAEEACGVDLVCDWSFRSVAEAQVRARLHPVAEFVEIECVVIAAWRIHHYVFFLEHIVTAFVCHGR